MRMGNTEVRALGGAPGCLAMILISIVASVLLTVVLNMLLREPLRPGSSGEHLDVA